MDKTLSIVESTANNASYADASKRKRADTTTTDATSRPASKTPRVLESDTEAVVFQTEIQGLKTHINELYKYIERKGLMTDVPLSIRDKMIARPGGAARLAKDIEAKMDRIMDQMSNDLCQSRHSGVTCDDVSRVAVRLVPQIKTLSELADLEAPILAIDLILSIANSTVSYVEEACGYDDRPSDKMLDDLLCDIFARLDERGTLDDLMVEKTVKAIEDKQSYIKGYGIEPWFPKTLARLKPTSAETDAPVINELLHGMW